MAAARKPAAVATSASESGGYTFRALAEWGRIETCHWRGNRASCVRGTARAQDRFAIMKTEIKKYVVDTFLFGQGDDLTDDSSFLEKGILDSTGVLELVAHIESTYGIKVNDDELLPDNLDSIDAICAFIERKKRVVSTPIA